MDNKKEKKEATNKQVVDNKDIKLTKAKPGKIYYRII